MSSPSFALRLSQQDVDKVVLESTGLLQSLGLPAKRQRTARIQEQIASFSPTVELDKLKALLQDCDGNCGWS